MSVVVSLVVVVLLVFDKYRYILGQRWAQFVCTGYENTTIRMAWQALGGECSLNQPEFGAGQVQCAILDMPNGLLQRSRYCQHGQAHARTAQLLGNKTVTTGEGGAVATDNAVLAARMRKVKGQGQSLTRRYWHDELGFNYRMTNIAAAIGVAQLERFETIVARKQMIAAAYRHNLAQFPVVFQAASPDVVSNEWLISLLLPEGCDRDAIMAAMANEGVDSRPVFYCAHQMPMYLRDESFPNAEAISARGISLPSYPGLSEDDVVKVCGVLKAVCS